MQFLIPVINMIAILFTTIAVVMFSHYISPLKRVVASGICLCGALSIVPIQNYVLLTHDIISNNGTLITTEHEPTIYWITLSATLLCAIFSSIMQSSLFGLAGAMSTGDGALTGALALGQGIAGVSVVGLRFVTKAGIGDALAAKSTLLFFTLGLVQVFVSVIIFVVSMLRHNKKAMLTASGMDSDADSHIAHARTINNPEEDIAQHEEENYNVNGTVINSEYIALEEHSKDTCSTNSTGTTVVVSTCGVLSKVWRQAGTACLVFTTCIACFPGLTASLHSTTYHLGSWFPLMLVGTYNIFDLIGKSLPPYLPLFAGRRKAQLHLPLCAALHVVFVPVFILLSNSMFGGDLAAFAVVGLLGLTTGYLGCSAMMLGPEQVESAKEREVAGILDTLGLVLGLTLGSVIGLVISAVQSGGA